MGNSRGILVLRDEEGAPFLVPQAVIEQEELVAFRVGENDYLIPRKTLLGSAVPDSHSADDRDGMLIRSPDGSRVWLSNDTLEDGRVDSPEERAAAQHALDIEVVPHSELDFVITPLDTHEIGIAGRGLGGPSFIS